MRMSEALRRTGSAARATGGALRSGTRRTGGLVHRVTSAQGAGRTGLSTLIELTAAAGAGDAFVAVSLAGTIFFNTSLDQARGKVVLFLVVTMAPFAVLAPFIGPALDRVQQGRKYLLAGTLLARGLLCYAMAAAVSNPINLLPAAFGVLVLQKAYGVVRASVTPRLLPEQITLVRANARSQLIAVITATLAAGLAAGIQVIGGAAWVLRVGMLIYLAAMVPALRLPDQVDSPPVTVPVPVAEAGPAARLAAPPTSGGRPPRGTDRRTAAQRDFLPNGPGRYPRAPDSDPWHGSAEFEPAGDGGTRPYDEPAAALPPGSPAASGPRTTGSGRWRTLGRVGPVVAEAMTGNAVLRAFSGFTLFFFVFLLQSERFGVSKHVALAALAVAVAGGSIVAMGIGSWLRSRSPQLIMFSVLTVAPAVAAASAWFFGLPAVIAVAFAAILCASLAKLAQDSIVQREIGDEIRSSTFAVSETLNQVANVAGGLLGVLVSMLDNGPVGLAIAAALLTAALVLMVVRRRRRVLAQRLEPEPGPVRPRPRPQPRSA
ncbi:MAG TPA: MFS transporter [Streptosporangiaceae bacterium]|nr:MFS transporter [Streptosporangiaceae bacterium]